MFRSKYLPNIRAMPAYFACYKMTKKGLDRLITTLALAGILISTYALYVEMSAEAEPEYQALCDLSELVSCSKVLTSDFSKGFGLVSKGSIFEIPNCIYGIIFYCLIIFLNTYDQLNLVRLQLFLSAMSVVSCLYLAYLLMFVLRDFCIVCFATYIVNVAIAYLVYKKFKNVLKKCR